jgi:RND family efflux transporter MFP subunit
MRRIVLLTSLFVILTACGEKPRKTESAAPVAAGSSVAVAMEEWPETYEATGTVRARVAGVVSSKVTGYVSEVGFQVGDHVREGQVLISLDARDLETGVARAAAAIREVESTIPEATSAIAAAKANLELAEVTLKRIQDLAAKKSVSTQELDETTARSRGARANYEMARARREQLDARRAQAEEERRAAEISRGYARILAPFAGLVTTKNVEVGNLASPGVPLATIEREGAHRLEAAVEESRIGVAKVGQTVSVQIDALAGGIAGRVAEIVPAVDAASRSYTVKIDLAARAQLRSGMFGRVMFPLGSRPVLAVPAEAVVERGQLQSVMVVEEGAARMRLVTIGRRLGGRVEVLSGLNAGERVEVRP